MPVEYVPVGDTSEFPVDALDQPNLYSTFSSGEDSNDQHLHNIFGTVLDSLDAQETSDSVSYTHLDVYKRQILYHRFR